MEELTDIPGREVSTQKNLRIPRGVIFDLDRIKNTSYKLTHNYVVVQILQAVIPRILEKIEKESMISLDGITVRL